MRYVFKWSRAVVLELREGRNVLKNRFYGAVSCVCVVRVLQEGDCYVLYNKLHIEKKSMQVA